jgi:ketosteroid isomerase-like protein
MGNRFLAILVLVALFGSCKNNVATDTSSDKKAIAAMLDSFNRAAANAEYDRYFNFYTEDAVFIGTDATENWDKKSYMAWAKPYFDKKTTWNFTSIERHIYFDKTGSLAWFDELLSTQMKICRGSGVVVKQGNDWKVQQYVLSTTIPNSQIDTVVSIKAAIEDEIIKKLSSK